MAARHFLEAAVLPGTDQKTGAEGPASNYKSHIFILDGAFTVLYNRSEVGVMQIAHHFLVANIFSGPDILVVLGIAVLLFGGKKLPELAKGLGEGIKSFKEAVKEEENKPSTPPPAATAEPKKQE
jgi:sec-independent protein translocase protein TatA